MTRKRRGKEFVQETYRFLAARGFEVLPSKIEEEIEKMHKNGPYNDRLCLKRILGVNFAELQKKMRWSDPEES